MDTKKKNTLTALALATVALSIYVIAVLQSMNIDIATLLKNIGL
ncbi:MAG: hypothetical protein RL637_917 [Pseudomonadota bacterium]